MPKNFTQMHHFILVRAFEVPRNFSRKVSCVRVWGGQPQHSIHTKKTRFAPRFLIIVIICWNCVREPCFKELFVKSSLKIRKNFASNYLFVFSKAFWFPKDFSRKALWSGFGADSPNIQCPRKKARRRRAFLFSITLL